MRCTNCGWDNTADSTRCIKCDTAISGQAPEKVQEKTVRDESPANGAYFGGTVADTDYSENRESNVKPEEESIVKCGYADCGYPNLGGAQICAMCKRPLLSEVTPVAGEPGKSNYKGTQLPPLQNNNNQSHGHTIDPYRVKNYEDLTCYLQLLNKDGEVIEDDVKEFTYDTEPLPLNRDNLDPDNMTITGRTQAELTYENGKWFLKDASDLKTTFIRVSESTELKEGDILLMGDRKFVFSTAKEE